MILAEKILALRTARGWSQEELAEKLEVSRQSVSKWESAASIPDLNRILQLSSLFGVSTDYLLRDELESPTPNTCEERSGTLITLRQAEEFLSLRRREFQKVALGVMLCILSPILLITLPVLAIPEVGQTPWITEEAAAGLGLGVLLLAVAVAVVLFITAGMKLDQYKSWEQEPIELEYGLRGILEQRLAACEKPCARRVALGVALCILSVVPLVTTPLFGAPDKLVVCMVGLLLAVVSVAVFLFITAVPVKSGCQILLRVGDYTPAGIASKQKTDRLGGIYWPLVTAGYLLASFLSHRWDVTWVVWPAASIIFGGLCAFLQKK